MLPMEPAIFVVASSEVPDLNGLSVRRSFSQADTIDDRGVQQTSSLGGGREGIYNVKWPRPFLTASFAHVYFIPANVVRVAAGRGEG